MRATDTGDTWMMVPQAGPPLLEQAARAADVRDRVEAPAEVLYRMLWKRAPIDDPELEIVGDRARVLTFLGSRLVP